MLLILVLKNSTSTTGSSTVPLFTNFHRRDIFYVGTPFSTTSGGSLKPWSGVLVKRAEDSQSYHHIMSLQCLYVLRDSGD